MTSLVFVGFYMFVLFLLLPYAQNFSMWWSALETNRYLGNFRVWCCSQTHVQDESCWFIENMRVNNLKVVSILVIGSKTEMSQVGKKSEGLALTWTSPQRG